MAGWEPGWREPTPGREPSKPGLDRRSTGPGEAASPPAPHHSQEALMKSHRRSQLQRSFAAGLAVAALAAPAAQAAPTLEPGTGDTPLSSEAVPVAPDAPAVTTTIDEGFDWGSAAIGAGGAGALIVLITLGGFKYASHTRFRVAP